MSYRGRSCGRAWVAALVGLCVVPLGASAAEEAAVPYVLPEVVAAFEIRTAEVFPWVRERIERAFPDKESSDRLRFFAGIGDPADHADVESVRLYSLMPPEDSGAKPFGSAERYGVVRFKRPVEPAWVAKTWLKWLDAPVPVIGDEVRFLTGKAGPFEPPSALHTLDDRTFLFGPRPLTVRALARPEPGPFARRLASPWVGQVRLSVRPDAISKFLGDELYDQTEALVRKRGDAEEEKLYDRLAACWEALLASKEFDRTLDLTGPTTFRLDLLTAEAKQAALWRELVADGKSLASAGAREFSPQNLSPLFGLTRHLPAEIPGLAIGGEGNRFTLTLPRPAKFDATVEDSLKAQAVGLQVQAVNNLRNIGLACMQYQSMTYQPAEDIVSPEGKPLWSWRVRLMPYLDDGILYRKLKLDQPWDSPHNLPLLERSRIWESTGVPPGHTAFLRFRGAGTCYPAPGKAEGYPQDGTATTVDLVVVRPEFSVPWAKPGGDLDFVAAQADKALAFLPERDILVIFRDTHTLTLATRPTARQFRALLSPNGGDNADLPAAAVPTPPKK